jgi:IMP cyclohydrolase
MPYIVGFLDALNRVAQIIVDLIPKYYVTPRTLPITSLDGKKSYIEINKPSGVMMNYDANTLNVKVEAGVNFSVQKSKALQQIIGLAQAMPKFAEFMNTEGLEVLLDNLEIRGVDQLKVMVAQFMQKQQQMQQMAMQQAQNNPQMINAQTQQQKVQLEAQQNETKNHLDMAAIAIDKQKADNDRMKIMLEANEQEQQRIVQRERMDVERAGQAIDVAMKVTDLSHRHAKETHELGHKMVIDHLKAKQGGENINV